MGLKEEVMDMKKEVKEVKEERKKSFAFELLEYNVATTNKLDKTNKRLIGVIVLLVILWAITIGYLVYVTNDIGVEETSVTQENADGYNNYIGNDGEINNG